MRRSAADHGLGTSRGDESAERHLRLGLMAVGIVLIVGTVALALVEHLSVVDALYDTLGLMTTSGVYDSPRSGAGRALAALVLVAGVGALFYTFGALAEYFIEGHFGRTIGRRRMERKIEQLQGHAIICGYGRVGRRIAREFASVGQQFVVVDPGEENAQGQDAAGYLHLKADATMDTALLRAGVQRAYSLLVATDSDAENIAITLSARALAPDLWIVARSNHDETDRKLIRAGANRVLSPYARAGHRMAVLARRPALSDFVDAALQEGEPELSLEELQVGEGSPLVGMQLPFGPGEVPKLLRDRLILAMRRAGTSDWASAPWHPGTIVRQGDCLIVLASGQPIQADTESRVERVATEDRPPDSRSGEVR